MEFCYKTLLGIFCFLQAVIQSSIWPGVSSSSCCFSTQREFQPGHGLCSQKHCSAQSRYREYKWCCV